MKLIDAVAIKLIKIKKEKDITQYKMSVLTGVPQSTISTIIKRQTATIKLSTIYDICSGLGFELAEFFSDDVFKNENLDD